MMGAVACVRDIGRLAPAGFGPMAQMSSTVPTFHLVADVGSLPTTTAVVRIFFATVCTETPSTSTINCVRCKLTRVPSRRERCKCRDASNLHLIMLAGAR